MHGLKVLEVVSGLGMGGAEKALISRLKYKPRGVESRILNIRPQIDSLKPPTYVDLLQNDGNYFQNILFLYKEVRKFSPDVVIVRTPADVIRLAIVNVVFRERFCFIFEAHSNFVTKKKYLSKIFSLIFRIASSRLSGIIAVSKSVARGPLCKATIPTKVCYLGSDVQFDYLGVKEIENVKFLFIGRMVDIKRPLWLIERFSNLKSTFGLEMGCLTIVGGGPLFSDARELVSRYGLNAYITLTGQQSDVLPYLSQHNYLISCSENEGLPITFFEAKLAGLRIISTPSGGGSEIFDNNDFVTPGFSEYDFEAALALALTDPAPSLIERRATSQLAAWMSAESCSITYYKALFAFLGLDGSR